MRALLLLGLAACAGPALEPVDPTVRASQLVQGFREADTSLDQLVEGAHAWAVFEGVEDLAGPCEHVGHLFRFGLEPREVLLRCRPFTPLAPGGQAYHLLVVLEGEEHLQGLAAGPLDLAGAREHALAPAGGLRQELSPDGPGPWVVTTARESLLFEARPLAPRLELVLPEPR